MCARAPRGDTVYPGMWREFATVHNGTVGSTSSLAWGSNLSGRVSIPMPNLAAALAALLAAASASAREVKGAPRGAWASYWAGGDAFACFDGSATISIGQLNDDYCDCADGSDEPGTGACERGSFFCANAGHKGQFVAASRVGDGICDCCDGSDERVATGVACEDTCAVTGELRESESRARETCAETAERARLGCVEGRMRRDRRSLRARDKSAEGTCAAKAALRKRKRPGQSPPVAEHLPAA